MQPLRRSGVGPEADLRASPVMDAAERLELALRFAAREDHAVELLVARDLDLQPLRQGIDDRHADAVQAARGLVGLAVELAARVERAHDDFERGLLREFLVRIDRDAAAVVRHAQRAVSLEFDIDEGGVAGDSLVHRIVDDLSEEMVQRLLVRTADIHAGTAADGLQPFENLDRIGVVIVDRRLRRRRSTARLLAGRRLGLGRGRSRRFHRVEIAKEIMRLRGLRSHVRSSPDSFGTVMARPAPRWNRRETSAWGQPAKQNGRLTPPAVETRSTSVRRSCP